MTGNRWYRHEIRVRYQETDPMGVVYHANYLNWFELGRTELIREAGLTYRELEARGLLLPVLEAELKFRFPARYDDRVAIYTRISEYSRLQIRFACELRRLPQETPAREAAGLPAGDREGELLVSGATRHVWLNREWKPVRIDREAPDLHRLLQTLVNPEVEK